MRYSSNLVLCMAVVAMPLAAQDTTKKKRAIQVTLTVPSSAEKIQIQEVYQTNKELWVLSQVKGGGIGLAVISTTKDQVSVAAPNLPVKHFVLGKRWNWKKEDYTYLKSRAQFDKMVKAAGAKKLYAAAKKPARYIVSLKKELFTNGKTKDGETLEQVGRRHAKLMGGKFVRVLNIINGYVLTLPGANVPKLKKLPEVKFIEEDKVIGISPPRIRP